MTRVIKIPYTPREVFIPIHRAFDSHRFCCLVAHRRMGKSVGNGNQLIKRVLYKIRFTIRSTRSLRLSSSRQNLSFGGI